MARLLILGGTGMLGAMCAAVLRDKGHDVATPPSSVADLTDARSLARAVAEQGFTAVVNCAVVKDFSDPARHDQGRAVNSVGPMHLARIASDHGLRFIQVSSDAVFGGGEAPYSEDDLPSPAIPYGQSKLMGEPDGALVIRGSFVGPAHSRTPSLMERLQRGEEIWAGRNELWNGLTSLEFAEALVKIVAAPAPVSGVRHVHGPDLDRWTLATALRQVFSLPGRVRMDERARDLRLATRFTDLPGVPVTLPLHDRLTRLRSEALRLGLWPADGSPTR